MYNGIIFFPSKRIVYLYKPSIVSVCRATIAFNYITISWREVVFIPKHGKTTYSEAKEVFMIVRRGYPQESCSYLLYMYVCCRLLDKGAKHKKNCLLNSMQTLKLWILLLSWKLDSMPKHSKRKYFLLASALTLWKIRRFMTAAYPSAQTVKQN